MILIAVAACGGGLKDGKSVYNPDKGNVPQLTVGSHPGGTAVKNCFVCHSGNTLEKAHNYNTKLAKSFDSLSSSDTGVCLYCHGKNNIVEKPSDESYKCTFCHANPKIVASATLFDGHMQAHAFNGSGKLNNSDCMTCHEFSDMDGKIRFDIDFVSDRFTETPLDTAKASSDFCLYCHSNIGALGQKPAKPQFDNDTDVHSISDTYKGIGGQAITADIHGVKDGKGQSFGDFRPGSTYSVGMEVSCLSCHEVHSSTNNYMITRSGDSARLADDVAQNASVAVHGNNFTELCALCHYTPGGIPTDNGLVEVRHGSEYDSDCTKCHYHGAGYGDKTDLF